MGDASATDKATAQALFDEGKRLMDQGQYSQACPKLADSLRPGPRPRDVVVQEIERVDARKSPSQVGALGGPLLRRAERRRDAGLRGRGEVAEGGGAGAATSDATVHAARDGAAGGKEGGDMKCF